MKKFFSFVAAVLFASSMMAEGLLFEQTYPGTPSKFTGAYTDTFTLATGGYTLTYVNYNNGAKSADNWDAIRAGRKSAASVATISSAAIENAVSKVVVNFTQADASKTNSLSLLVADNAAFTGATEINATIAVGEVAFVIASPAANKFYQVKMDMAEHGSSNGFNRIDKVQFIVAEGGTPIVPPVYDTLSVAEALDVAGTLAKGASTAEKYYVEGYAVKVEAYSAQYGNQIFYMVDDMAAQDNSLEAYAAYPAKDGEIYPVLEGDFVRAFGKIKNFNGVLELVNPTVEFIEEVAGDRTIPGVAGPDTITVAQAVAIAEALDEPAENGKSTTDTKEYVVKGFAVQVYPKNDDGTWSFFMADEAGAYGPFSASNTSTDADVVENDFMLVRGKIAKRKTNAGKIQLQIYKGTGVHGVAPQGIENVTLTEKAQKVMIDGVMYIVRDNKMYNAQGVQVR